MKNVHIIFTGGTIAMRTNDAGMLVPAVSGEDLLSAIPILQKTSHITTSQFSNIPSAQVTPSMLLELRNTIIDHVSSEQTSGIVIVHGTDTMEESAFFLDACLSNDSLNSKPVVLTGAMRSNDQPSADGAANLLSAVQVASSSHSKHRGVMIVMNDEIHSARFVKKMSTSSLQTFSSPQHMPIGHVTHSSDIHDCVQFNTPANRLTPVIDVSRETTKLPRVDIILMHSGADGALLEASLNAGARAIVIQAVGASSVNLELYQGIKTAIEQGVAIIISSRSPLGICSPVYGYVGGGKTLEQLGACFSQDLPAHKARLYAQLILSTQMQNIDAVAQMKNAFKKLSSKHKN